MFNRRMVIVTAGFVLAAVVTGGCDSLRFAPGEVQKQNAYLHHKTVQVASMRARQESASEQLQKLTESADRQSEAIMAYYGLPREIPASDGVEELLSEENESITSMASQEAIERPDPWEAADHVFELGLALAGVVGGVYGGRAAGVIKQAKQKSQALREIVTGNELFKKRCPEQVVAFKQSHKDQSETTRKLVSVLK